MMKTQKLVKLSLLVAISLVIFVIETRIPNLIPIPGVKLGLANIVTVWSVYNCKAHETAMLLLTRIVLGAIFCGTALSFIYSFCGAAACFIVCIAIKRLIPRDKMWLMSVVGAIFHNLGQITAATIVMRTTAVLVYLPILMVSGIIAGLFCGLGALFVDKRLHKLR